MTYTLIAHQELGSAQASIEFTSIPTTFSDLVLMISVRVTNAGIYEQDLLMTFNNTSANRSTRRLFANASSNGLGQSRSDMLIGQVVSALDSSPSFSTSTVYIPNYRSSAVKSASSDSGQIAFNSSDGMWANLTAMRWNDTAAITSIQISPSSQQFVQFSSATLYGITAGSSGGVVIS